MRSAERADWSVKVKAGQALELALGDDAQLHVTMIGGEFAAELIPIQVGLPVQILVTGKARPWFRGLHPELIPIGSNGVDGLLEGHFNFEAHTVELNNLERRESQIGAKQYFTPRSGWMTRMNRTRRPNDFRKRSRTW